MACLIELAVFTWFTAALGVTMSLRSKNTVQALTQTIGLLFVLNVGYMVVFIGSQVDSMRILVGCMPFHFTVSLLGMHDLDSNWSRSSGEVIFATIVGTVGYALGAAFLTYRAIRSYDAVVDRPDRGRGEVAAKRVRQLRAQATKPATATEL